MQVRLAGSFVKRIVFATAGLFLLAQPVAASTMPCNDLVPGQTVAAIGAGAGVDVNIDRAVTDWLALGATGWYMPGAGVQMAAARTSFLLPFSEQSGWSLTLSGGYSVFSSMFIGFLDPTPPQILSRLFFQPALAYSAHLGENWRFRMTLGPVWCGTVLQDNPQDGVDTKLDSFIFPLWPNFEFAYRTGDLEFTLGGNSIFGVRRFF